MSNSSTFPEPTRPLPTPRPDCDGNLRGSATLSPTACKTRARLPIAPSKVIPVIVVPGIMGSNLCATTDPRKEKNRALKPGEAAWRPPNGVSAGLDEATKWKGRGPGVRQQILDPDTLDVDPNGTIGNNPDPAYAIDEAHAREDGWGEIHASSYGLLLLFLQKRLNTVFRNLWGSPVVESDWLYLNKYDRKNWNTTKTGIMAELSSVELDKFAEYHYPVYAFGYNWLQSNELSAAKLQVRIAAIIARWTSTKQDCKQVILVTHSMGGLVGRACAKKIPEKIVGIVHGVMPALGAPVCYRRIACGTESSSPSKGKLGNVAMGKFAEIAGDTSATTTPVMATAPGPLELLPNHLYPKPWLFAAVGKDKTKPEDVLRLPEGNPYDLYRDTTAWYRMIDPQLADPANKYDGQVAKKIKKSIEQAENFHTKVLDTYYHPNSYAFFGADADQLSFGTCRWTSATTGSTLLARGIAQGKNLGGASAVGRNVELTNGSILSFEHSVQDVAGDGTVPQQSGAGPTGLAKQTFRTQGYDHQGSYGDESMLMLTQHLIAKIVQAAR